MHRIPAESISNTLAVMLGASAYTVGFTGPRRDMTAAQRQSLDTVLRALPTILGAHHGDCVGADAEFHALCASLEIPIHIT